MFRNCETALWVCTVFSLISYFLFLLASTTLLALDSSSKEENKCLVSTADTCISFPYIPGNLHNIIDDYCTHLCHSRILYPISISQRCLLDSTQMLVPIQYLNIYRLEVSFAGH